jgi:alpha-glucosidase (family GH31 glycosyl hydrolase)
MIKALTIFTIILSVLLLTKGYSITKMFQRFLSFNKSFLKVERKFNYNNKILCNLNNMNLKLSLEVTFINSNDLRIFITDSAPNRYFMPEEEPFPHYSKKSKKSQMNLKFLENLKYSVEINDNPFVFNVYLKETHEKIFSIDAKNYPLTFSENLLDITVTVPTKYIFGLGERSFDFKLREGIYTLYNRDQYGVEEDGKGGKNRYGSHPMYLVKDKHNNYHVNYLRNPLPMDVIIKENKAEDSYLLNYKILGGVIDFHLFTGDHSPEKAIRSYHDFLGGYELPPFWSMGWHQCRWGYKNLKMLREVLENYHKHKVPLDVLWMDIDYMKGYMPFTYDNKRYNIVKFNEMLQKFRKKFVMIVEPAVALKSNLSEHLKEGIEKGLFIKNGRGSNLVNRVWPGNCYFIDYFNPKSKEFWIRSLSNFHKKIKFSGVWLDMNEVATFVDGQINYDQYGNEITYDDPCDDKTNYPYLPGNTHLMRNTICPNAVHYNNVKHINLHNYLPAQQAMLTNLFLQSINKNEYPFILSRANAPGMGKYSIHWTGDNYSTYNFMKYSLQEIMNSNMFGMPMVGADICGFGGIANELLCARWMQLGTLYPFARSHAHLDSNRKEFWQFGEIMLNTSKITISYRYKLLKFYYSLFIRSQKRGTIFRPLFFEYPSDMAILDNDQIINSQVMIYDSLMLTPNLSTQDTINVYFPQDTWFDLRNYSKVINNGFNFINAQLNDIAPLFLRGGKSIFLQNVDNLENSYDLDQSFELIIGLGNEGNEKKHSITYLPALNDYNNKQDVEDCIHKDCMFKIITVYVNDFRELNIKIVKPSFIKQEFSGVFIKKLVILGLETDNKNFNKISSNLDAHIIKQNPNEPNFHINVNNHFSFEIIFNGSIKVNGELDIFFKFLS